MRRHPRGTVASGRCPAWGARGARGALLRRTAAVADGDCSESDEVRRDEDGSSPLHFVSVRRQRASPCEDRNDRRPSEQRVNHPSATQGRAGRAHPAPAHRRRYAIVGRSWDRRLRWSMPSTITEACAGQTRSTTRRRGSSTTAICAACTGQGCVQRSFDQMDADATIYHTMNGPERLPRYRLAEALGHQRPAARDHAPTLLVSGGYDEATRLIVGQIHQRIAGAVWTLFEESSHLPHVEEPEASSAASRTSCGRSTDSVGGGSFTRRRPPRRSPRT